MHPKEILTRDIPCIKNQSGCLQKRQVERTYENARLFGNRFYYIDSGKPKTKKATTTTTTTTTTKTTTTKKTTKSTKKTQKKKKPKVLY